MVSRFKETALPCPCGSSSDAYSVNEDGSGKCFSCSKFFANKQKEETLVEEKEEPKGIVTYEYVNHRGISKKTREFYGVQTKLIDGVAFSHLYPYPNDSGKIRVLPKEFKSTGPIGQAHLFGKDKFPPGSKPGIVITEGEEDAMSVCEMLNGRFAAVSVKNAATAFGDIKAEWEYLNSFGKIYLCLDNDGKAGSEATRMVTSSGIFDYEKLYKVNLTYKDANDYLLRNDAKTFLEDFAGARRSMPDSIINSFGDIARALETQRNRPLVAYPFSGLTDNLFGIHKPEMILVKGPEGTGKTEFCKALVHKALKDNPSVRAATIFLEETEDVTIKSLATYELDLPCNLETQVVSNEEILEGYKRIVDNDDSRLYIQKHLPSDDTAEFVDNIRFLVTVCGCDLILLDNLTVMVTGKEEGDDSERMRIDALVRRLWNLVLELNFCLVVVSHVNDNGQTRGSRLVGKLANTVISIKRDLLHADISERNRVDYLVEKMRIQGGKTGPAGSAFFDPITFKLRDVQENEPLQLQLPSFLE